MEGCSEEGIFFYFYGWIDKELLCRDCVIFDIDGWMLVFVYIWYILFKEIKLVESSFWFFC